MEAGRGPDVRAGGCLGPGTGRRRHRGPRHGPPAVRGRGRRHVHDLSGQRRPQERAHDRGGCGAGELHMEPGGPERARDRPARPAERTDPPRSRLARARGGRSRPLPRRPPGGVARRDAEPRVGLLRDDPRTARWDRAHPDRGLLRGSARRDPGGGRDPSQRPGTGVGGHAIGGDRVKLGVFTVLYRDLPFEEALDRFAAMGLEAVEIGTGNYPGDAHCKPGELLADPTKPEDFLEILEWQWNEVAIPYWTEAVAFARSHGVTKIAFEMHPGFLVYNPETLLRLRAAAGREIGANLDPSHLFWQGIDAVEAIKTLGGEDAIFHVHAKDTYIDEGNVRRNGILDTKHYRQIRDRAWTFRTVGYGMGEKVWRDIVSALRAVGYDDVLSIEHEDLLLSIEEGLRRGIDVLTSIIPREPQTEIWWA